MRGTPVPWSCLCDCRPFVWNCLPPPVWAMVPLIFWLIAGADPLLIVQGRVGVEHRLLGREALLGTFLKYLNMERPFPNICGIWSLTVLLLSTFIFVHWIVYLSWVSVPVTAPGRNQSRLGSSAPVSRHQLPTSNKNNRREQINKNNNFRMSLRQRGRCSGHPSYRRNALSTAVVGCYYT